jgi:cell shape-determining protein MreC
MPEYAMWTLIVALIMLSFSTFLKLIDVRKRLKSINKVLQDKNRELEDVKKQLEEKIIGLTNKISEFEKVSKKNIHEPVDLSKPKNHISDYDPYENL